MNMKYKLWDCCLKVGKYQNGNTRLELTDADSGEPIAVATVNVDERLPSNEAFIKDYSENTGMVAFLQEHKIISTNKLCSVRTGYVTVDKYKLLV